MKSVKMDYQMIPSQNPTEKMLKLNDEEYACLKPIEIYVIEVLEAKK